MKQIVLSIAMCLLAGGMMAQSASDKAAAKEAAKALKAAKKEAKANLAAAQKVKDDIYARIADKEKPASEDEVLSACKMGQGIVVKAIESGHLDEDVLGQAYKLSGDLAVYPLNIYLNAAKDKLALEKKTIQTIEGLDMKDIQMFLELKWILPITSAIEALPDAVIQTLADVINALSEKYSVTYNDIERSIAESEQNLAELIGQLTGDEFAISGLSNLIKK